MKVNDLVEYSVGIDLGTTYSCLAYVDLDGEIRVQRVDNKFTTPSVIYFEDQDNYLVGNDAKNGDTNSVGYISAVKRNMGTNEKYPIKGTDYNPQTLSAIILKKMIDEFNKEHNTTLRKAVISVPNHFSGSARQATIDAGKIAGLEEIELIDEPVSASLSYGLVNSENKGKIILVYDLGGGTFDSTVLKINSDGSTLNTLSTDGRQHLGGIDWDGRLADIILQKVLESDDNFMSEEDLRNDSKIQHDLLKLAEEVKKKLSNETIVETYLSLDPFPVNFTVTREEFEEATIDLLEMTMTFMDSAIEHAGLELDDISKIVLVGGSSNMPQVRNIIEDTYPGISIELFEPDYAIAKGDAIYASWLNKNNGVNSEEYTALSDDTMIPKVSTVLSKTYGTDAEDPDSKMLYVVNIIHRDQPLPCKETQCFYPVIDGQVSTIVGIYENSKYITDPNPRISFLKDSIQIGQFDVQLPKNIKIDDVIKITFEATLGGLLIATVDCEGIPQAKYELKINDAMTVDDIVMMKKRVASLNKK